MLAVLHSQIMTNDTICEFNVCSMRSLCMDTKHKNCTKICATGLPCILDLTQCLCLAHLMQVIDELRQVLNGVDVVMGRW